MGRNDEKLRAPFPYFGGKSRVTSVIWSRFGDTHNFVDPFCGSCAILLGRPHWPWPDGERRIETVNDADGYLCNFWRALQAEPDAVAYWADWPVNELDLHARHSWLINEGAGHVERLRTDPEYYDVKIAGWWVWGISQWIGGDWCRRAHRRRPQLTRGGTGIHRASVSDLRSYFSVLSERLRRVRVCCGDWSRVLGPSPTTVNGLTAVVLDPPYTDKAGRAASLYTVDDPTVGHAVRAWALEHGDDPLLRIALCGYAGEHDMPESWECFAWTAHGGYGRQGKRTRRGRENRSRERIWFSPHCLKSREADGLVLFQR